MDYQALGTMGEAVADESPSPVVYTTAFGHRDELRPPVDDVGQSHGVRWVRFTTQHCAREFQGWDNRYRDIAREEHGEASRWYKMHPHLLFPNAPWTIWMDATHQMRIDPCEIMPGLLGDGTMATFPHIHTADEEFQAICARFPDRVKAFDEQRAHYERGGFSYNQPIRMGTVIFRANTTAQRAFDELWWAETVRGGYRDQIAQAFLVREGMGAARTLPGNAFFHPWFTYTHHDGDRGTKYPKVWGPFPRQAKRTFRRLLPPDLQRNWCEERIERYLARMHGRGADYQYPYYRCQQCKRLVTWHRILAGGCKCGGNRLTPAILRWWDIARLVLVPWSV